METPETNENTTLPEVQPKKKSKTPLILIILVVVIIAAVAAYFLLGKTTKQKYFSAEKNSFDQIVDYVEDRYEPEITWHENSLKKPTEVDLSVTAELTDDAGYLGSEIVAIVNNAEINIAAATDYGKKVAAASLSANVGPFAVNDLNFGVTEDELIVDLPFVSDTWLISDGGLYDKLVEADVELADDVTREDFDFAELFETSEILDEKDIKYIEKEYVMYVYDLLDEESFTESTEKVEVNGKKVNTDAIEMNVSEKQVKSIIKKVAKKAKDDEKLHDILYDQVILGTLGSSVAGFDQIDMKQEFNREFADGMDEIINNVDEELDMPDGIVSKIWTHKNSIVQREINIKTGGDFPGTLEIVGEQLIKKDGMFADYTINVNDEFDEIEMKFEVDSTWEKGKADDLVKLTLDDEYDKYEVIYTGEETLKSGTRDFERGISFVDQFYEDEMFSLSWTGKAKYDSKKATIENEFAIAIPDFLDTPVKLMVDQEARQVKSVETPDTKDAMNFDDMTLDEIYMYMFNEVEPAITQEFGF